MKKILLALMGMVMAFSVSAATYEQGTHYTVLNKAETEKPQVIEFFSFYCPACFQFDQNYKVSQKIKAELPKEVEYHKYHVAFMGGDVGMMLTQAWAVAMVLDVEEQVKPLLFDAVQVKRNLKSQKDIRDIFIKAGVKAEEFDELWDSFVVKSLISKQLQAVKDLELEGVPAIYVNGKYQINLNGMKSIQDFVDATLFLVNGRK